jgi:hypothetical protein
VRRAGVAAVLLVGAVVLVGLLARPGDDGGAGVTAGRAAPASQPDRPRRLTDPAWKGRVLPPDEVLRDQARRLPAARRQLWGWDAQRQAPLGWVLPGHDPDVFPVFVGDGDVAGIAVGGVGLVPRADFEDPSVDLEDLARRRWGPEYDRLAAGPPTPSGPPDH